MRFRQNRHFAASSIYDRPNAVHGMKSQLHPVCSTAAYSLHLFSYEHTFSVVCSSVFDFLRFDFSLRCLRTEFPDYNAPVECPVVDLYTICDIHGLCCVDCL